MKLKGLLLFLFLSLNYLINAQDFMMQGWYWDYPKTCNGSNWANNLSSKAAELGGAGFTYVWLPPMSRASFGSCSNGYDPKDLYDLGEYGQGATGFGTRADVDAVISSLNSNGIQAVADVVYNHRDGGQPEDNPAVRDYIMTHYSAGKSPFPSDRYRCVLPLGGASGNGAGKYYFKMSSKTNGFANYNYKIYMETNTNNTFNGSLTEDENNGGSFNGGGDCGQGFNVIQLGYDMEAVLDDNSNGCRTDEFELTLTAADFNPAGDELIIYLNNIGGSGYSDHRFYGIWNAAAGADVIGQLKFQTFTNFNGLPSGQGGLDWNSFSPNSTNASTIGLNNDEDAMLFFYDYDQNAADTRSVLFDYSDWLLGDVGIGGLRMDAVKHFPASFVGDMLDQVVASGHSPGMVVGEHFTVDAGALKNWVGAVEGSMDPATQAAVQVRAFDFDLRQSLKNACDAFGYDSRNVFNSGIYGTGGSSFNAVTFINNHDYRHPGEEVINDPILAYAYILTNNKVGVPTVFYPDYFGGPTSNPVAARSRIPSLKTEIDELIAAHVAHIYGGDIVYNLNGIGSSYTTTHLAGSVESAALIYQISQPSQPEVVVAINFSGTSLKVDQQIDASRLVERGMEDILGNSAFPYAVVQNGSNEMYIELPARSYSIWVEKALSALPAELLSFHARPESQNVLLDWTIAQEENVEGYEVQRSYDGSNFETIHFEKAIGTSDKYTYRFVDKNVRNNQDLFYRINTKDRDGTASLSDIEIVNLKDGAYEFEVRPNPTSGASVLSFSANQNTKANLSLMNAVGQKVKSFEIDSNKGMNEFPIDFSSFEKGVYLLVLEQDGTRQVRKVVVR